MPGIDAATLAYDGTSYPDVLTLTVENLELDKDYGFFVTAINPIESEPSEPLVVRAAGFPDAPSLISEIAGSRTGT